MLYLTVFPDKLEVPIFPNLIKNEVTAKKSLPKIALEREEWQRPYFPE